MATSRPQLSVNIIRGAGLAASDIGGKSDPFCHLTVLSSLSPRRPLETKQTNVVKNTLDPLWNQQFHFHLIEGEDPSGITLLNRVLEFHVYDHDTIGDNDDLGVAIVDLSKTFAPRYARGEKTLQLELGLQATNKIKKAKGSIYISISVDGIREPESSTEQESKEEIIDEETQAPGLFSRAQGVVGGALNLASSGWSWTKFGISTGFWAAGRGIRLPGRLLSQLRGGEGLNRFAVSMTAPREVVFGLLDPANQQSWLTLLEENTRISGGAGDTAARYAQKIKLGFGRTVDGVLEVIQIERPSRLVTKLTVPSGHFEVETVYELSTAESDQAVTQLNVTEKLTYDYRVLSLVGPIVEQFAIQYKLETDISYFKQLAEKSIKPSPESSGSH